MDFGNNAVKILRVHTSRLGYFSICFCSNILQKMDGEMIHEIYDILCMHEHERFVWQMLFESLLTVAVGWICFIPSASPVNPGKSDVFS